MEYPSSKFNHIKAAEPAVQSPLTPPPPPNIAPPAEEESSGGNKIGGIIEMLGRRAPLIIGIASLFILNAAWKLSQQPEVYAGNFQILVEPTNAEFEAVTGLNEKTLGTGTLDYETQLTILKSPTLLLPVVEELKKTYPDFNLGFLAENLKIRRLGETTIIRADFQSNSQPKTQGVLEVLANTYLEYSLTKRQTYLRQGLKYVNEQLEIRQKLVNDLQSQLQSFRQKHGFFDPEVKFTELTTRLGQLTTEKITLDQQLLNLQKNTELLQTEDGLQGLLAADAGYQEFLVQIREIDTTIGQERTRFQDSNIVIESLMQKRANLIELLSNQANQVVESQLSANTVQIKVLENGIRNNTETQVKIQQEIQRLPNLIREYENLDRQNSLAVDSLTSFLQSRQSLQIQSAQSEIPWELIQKPDAEILPSDLKKALINKIVMGIAIGMGAAFALDKLDGSFHTVDASVQKIKVPLLGILPFNQQVFLAQENSAQAQKRKRKLLNRIIQIGNHFSSSAGKMAIALFEEYDGTVEFFESLRVIHTNIQRIALEKGYRTFAVTSATVGDGKTTLAINWADTAAVMGQKVLLIDACFRKPEIHEFLNLKNEQGLNTLLNDPQIDPMPLVQKVFPTRDFYILSAGPVHEKVAGILTVERIQLLIKKLQPQFDLIIFDIPSVLGIADASLFSRSIDSLVLIASLHKTSQSLIKKTLDELENKQTPVLGMVLNRQKGADPVLRATLSQSSTVSYFPNAETEVNEMNDANTIDLSEFDEPMIIQPREELPTDVKS